MEYRDMSYVVLSTPSLISTQNVTLVRGNVRANIFYSGWVLSPCVPTEVDTCHQCKCTFMLKILFSGREGESWFARL